MPHQTQFRHLTGRPAVTRGSRSGAAALAALAVFAAGAPALAVELEFITHVEADMWEQDVFVELAGSGGRGVFRVGPGNYAELGDAELFATTRTVHHDPTNPDAAGPYPKGEPLDLSLDQWLAASGTASYTCDDGIGRLEASFENLVPEGVYTLWYFFVPTPPAEPFSTYDLPLGDRAGRENAFFADSRGRADYQLTLSSCLQGSGTQLDAGIAAAWHSDGATYGSNPGGFGRVTHVQLFVVLPADDELNR